LFISWLLRPLADFLTAVWERTLSCQRETHVTAQFLGDVPLLRGSGPRREREREAQERRSGWLEPGRAKQHSVIRATDGRNYMRMILDIALAIALMSVGSASAQIVNMNTATCNDFIGFKRDTIFAIVMWLDAYYLDEDDPPIIDFDKIRQKAARLTVYCNQNPTYSLATASEPIMGRK
jgi:acid stress chaperone HdeB